MVGTEQIAVVYLIGNDCWKFYEKDKFEVWDKMFYVLFFLLLRIELVNAIINERHLVIAHKFTKETQVNRHKLTTDHCRK